MNSRIYRLRNYILHKTFSQNINKFKTEVLILHKRSKVGMLISGFWYMWPTNTKNNSMNVMKDISFIPPVLELSDKMYETGKYEECYKTLVKYEDQDNAEIKWRICRALYNMAKDPKYDKKVQKDFVSQGYKIIVEELEKNSNNFAVHKWYALLLDAKSLNEGTQEKIQQLENIKKHMDIAVTLNPNDASLLHMLGEWCFQITEIPWYQRKTAEAIFGTIPQSTYEDALEYYLRAESAQPRFYSINLLRLGCCYLKLNKEDQAKYYLKLAASYPAKSDEDHYANKQAAELLKKKKLY